jgi:hypothetical protein
VADIFFSYSSVDRERVRPIHDALVAQGFQVFWDQKVPAGQNWDNWIRQHLTQSKCAIVFWSATSVGSDNVRHEAVVAKQQGKLVSVLLEELSAEQFPMGLYAQQAANLSRWDGDLGYEEWRKLRRDFEAKLTPAWVRRQIDELEAELVGERARREGAEHRDSVLQAQIAKEAKTQQELKRERNEAREEIAALKITVEELMRARSELEARETDALQQVAALRATVDEVTRARSDAEQRLSKVRQVKAKEIVRSVSPFVIAAALATVGIWTYQIIWPAPQSVPAVISESASEAERELAAIKQEAERQAKAAVETQAKLEAAEGEQQRLKDEVQRQTKAAAEVEAKLQVAQSEQQRQAKVLAEAQTKLQGAQTELQIQAKAAKDADDKRKTAEADQQRLKDDVQRQTRAAAEADTKRRDAAEQQRLAVKLEEERKATAAATPAVTRFERRNDMVGAGLPFQNIEGISIEECEAKCSALHQCSVLSYSTRFKICGFYSGSGLVAIQGWDSGVRQAAVLPAGQPALTVKDGLFRRRPNEQASGLRSSYHPPGQTTLDECEQKCAQAATCKVFTYNKINSSCSFYTRADFIPNADFDSGVRN